MDLDKPLANGEASSSSLMKSKPKDEKKKDQDFYFNFYSSLQNQANMIGDISRTGTYRKAILANSTVAFKGKRVLDVGAGSGILSFMSVQAGADRVIALEASSMADKLSILVKAADCGRSNPHLKDKVQVVRGMVEDDEVQRAVLVGGKVDTIISEPIGVMLLHERMVESFILARDLFLKPGGQIFPSDGHIFFCPFTDEALYNETDQKAQFFNSTLFGTDFRDIFPAARKEVFAQPVVGMFPPPSLVASASPPKSFDFSTCTSSDLTSFQVPIDFVVTRTALIHGLASWFDLSFTPRTAQANGHAQDDASLIEQWNYPVNPQGTWPWMAGHEANPLNPGPTPMPPKNGLDVSLSTGPQAQRTHWQQTRLLLPSPLAVNASERICGNLRFEANDSRSYDIKLEIWVDRPGVGRGDEVENPLVRRGEWQLQNQCFNYSYNPEAANVPGGLASMGYGM